MHNPVKNLTNVHYSILLISLPDFKSTGNNDDSLNLFCR